MTLFKQLILGISVLFAFLLAGVEAIYIANARVQLQEQLGSQARDAATSLSLRLGALGSLEDRILVETMLNPVFDSGYFQEIHVLSPSGETVVRKSLPPRLGDVPEWFVWLFPIRAPGAQSLVNSGWRELGRVAAVSQPYFAYQQLWNTGVQTIAWVLLGYALAIGAAFAFLTTLLRPLREIERAAIAISDRQFVTIPAVPRTRDLASVVTAMNVMSGSIRKAISEETARAETLRREAYVDPVTTLYNRRGFESQMQSLIGSTADVYSVALALVETQNFTTFNSRFGWRRGDEVLAMMAGALVAACSGSSVVCARIGGAGFAVAAMNVDTARLRDLVAAVCDRIGQLLIDQQLDSELNIHTGATYWEGGTRPDLSALLASADLALEKARSRADNSYEIDVFDPSFSVGSQAWRALIERCLESDGITLFSQDVFTLPERKPAHFEATARLLGVNGLPIPAAQFLPMAARHGLVERLDIRVLELLLDHLSARPGNGMAALNLAARSIANEEAGRELLAMLDARAGLASRLIFEMTEYGAMRDFQRTLRFVAEVRRRGARFALDNYGMRQDSLIMVHALRPQYIKLSAGYSREVANNVDCRFLVTSLTRVLQPLGIGIYAQAVEDESLLPLFAELGISGYQGFVSSRPVQIT